jgi:Helicase HerA, central domain
MQDFEKLGVFYLGKSKSSDDLLLYDSKDLVTHAVCVGMTGSGKTGLCISLLEEAAIDNIPAIIIDPKGDLCNLLLQFPNLAPQDFAPWVEEGVDPAQQATLWKEGLAKWGEDGERIRRLQNAADFRIYTPGSNAGLPVSILKSFAAPPEAIRQDNESLAERINTTVTSLLALVGIEGDPVRSREHILISNILNQEWSNGKDLDIAGLIQKVQSPSITKIGVMDLDSFFPADDRFQLAMTLNHLLASPSFASWMEGEALDIPKFLHTESGKPRHSIFSIAHLGDAERMFFVSLLLHQVLGWMRTQSGTTSLRAILYMDEIFGYFPPVANPPSKLPLLTLLKQGRAFGLGVVLATQNPVDLDYKGLANTGTWFIGRLQTERDKARVLEGLEGIAAGTGQKFDKQAMEQLLAGLDKRVFLLNNVHDDAPELFETRWALSYLRGPLTRAQIKLLMDPVKQTAGAGAGTNASAAPAPAAAPLAPAPATAPAPSKAGRSLLPPDITQYYIPVRSSGDANVSLTYHPALLGAADVRYSNSKTVDITQQVTLLAPFTEGPVNLDWASAVPLELPIEDLESEAQAGAQFAEAPPEATKAKSYASWRKDLASWLYRNQRLELLESPTLNIVSNPGESERDFRVRLQQLGREQRDEAVEKLRRKYAPKLEQLEERKRRAEQAVARESEQAKGQKVQTAISFGATLLSSFLGRKRTSLSTLGRATTAVRGVGRSMKESQDVDRAEDNVAAISQKLADLEAEFQSETAALERSLDSQTEQLEKVSLKPTKANIAVKLLTLAWAPYWDDKPAWE